ncbi:STAS domain-containing protein [Bombella saccharophila]|uniref:STAS domain-containing protein n=1 Tax=Bombella saccharophila TaxID=2967338 RepID=A0ABT3W8H3_9PROT|nr:STAS domain-containing protein [Bombella saccharophila]MCX5614973.1 STAS domain-containing protein [Bombella saccharophila]
MQQGSKETMAVITLPSRLDTKAADGLKSLLLDGLAAPHAEASLMLDASAVEYVGGLCLQLLLASGLQVGPCSEEAEDAFTLFGVREQLVGRDREEATYGG